jgi:hypothetical protein
VQLNGFNALAAPPLYHIFAAASHIDLEIFPLE